MERCPNCGVETRPGDQFCLNCGNRLTGSQPAAANPFPPPPQPAANPFGPPPGMTPGGMPSGQGAPWFGGPGNPPTTPTMPTVQAPFSPATGTGGTTLPNSGPVGGGFALGDAATVTAPEILEPTVRAPATAEPEVLERTIVPPSAPSVDEHLPTVSSSDLKTQLAVEEVEVTITSVSESPAKLIVSRNGQTREFLLKKPDISIGRAPSNDVALSGDQLASRRHALIHFDGVNYTIRDLVSANGTYINGVELRAPTVLNNGDHIGIGEHELVFFTVDTSANEPPTITISAPEISQTSFETISVSEREETMGPASALGTRDGATQAEGMMTAAASFVEEDREGEVVTESAEAWAATVRAPSGGLTPTEFEPTATAEAALTEGPSTIPASPAMPEATIIEPLIVIDESRPTVEDEEEEMEAPALADVSISERLRPAETVNEEDMPLPVPQLPEIPTILSAIKSLDATTSEMRENLRQAKVLEEQAQSLRDQLRAATEAISNHDNSVAVLAQRLRVGVADVSNRLNKVIEEVTRADESLSIAELMKLIDDVRNDPRDIYTLGSLARRARELAQFFELHQHINQILSECLTTLNNLLSAEMAKPDGQ